MTIIDFPTKNSTPAPSFDALVKHANKLTKASAPKVYMGLLNSLAAAKLDGIQVNKILNIISEKLGCPLKIVRSEYTTIKNKLRNTHDLCLQIAGELLNHFYADGLHLKRNADGCYYVFDETHWRLISPDVIRNQLQKVANKYLADTNKGLAALVGEALRCLNDLLAEDGDLLNMTDILPSIINCQNTEIRLKTDAELELSAHHPASRLFSCLDHEYHSEATCPVFDKSLHGIFAKSSQPEEMVRHFEEILGHIISGRRHIAMFLLMIGQGNNGKSKLLETTQKLVGESAVLCDSLATFQRDRFNMAALHGKQLFCDDDLKHGITLNDEMIKKTSESKPISARHPYGKKKFTFRNLALPMIAANDYPRTDDISWGMIRRAYIIPFDRQFTPKEDDKALFPYIWENEMPGVLNRAIQGLQRLTKRGGFLEPADCVQARKEFFAHANPLYAFLTDYAVQAPGAKIKVRDFREVYALWAKGQGVMVNKEDKRLLRLLRGLQNEFGYTVTSDTNKAAYSLIHGIVLKGAQEAENDG